MSVNYQPRGSLKEFKSAYMDVDHHTGRSFLRLIATDNTVVAIAAKWKEDLTLCDRFKWTMGCLDTIAVDMEYGFGEKKALCIDVNSLAENLDITYAEAKQLLADESAPLSFPDESASLKSIFKRSFQPHANFRKTDLSLKGRKIEVAGMAHPVRYSPDSSCAKSFDLLFKMGFRNLISLDNALGSSSVKPTWESHEGGRHHVIQVHDFKAPTQADYDEIFAAANEAALAGEKMVIHCGEGWGRTGSALASLQLRYIFDKMESNEAAARAYLSQALVPNTIVNLGEYSLDESGKPLPEVMATPLVAEALNKTRESDWHGVHVRSTHGSSVENKEQVDSLVELENRLRIELRKIYT